jgi:hypothetical protein
VQASDIIATLALIVSAISALFSIAAYLKSRAFDNAKSRSALLTGIVSLRLEYESLVTAISRKIAVANNETARADLESILLSYADYLDRTDSYYTDLADRSVTIDAVTLEMIKHHIDALQLKTKADIRKVTEGD